MKGVAGIPAKSLRLQGDSIGNVHWSEHNSTSPQSTESGLPTGYKRDPMVCDEFFWGKHISLDIPRGLYLSSRKWLYAILAHKKYDCDQAAQEEAESGSESDSEDEIDKTRNLIKDLSELMPKKSFGGRRFAFRHNDLHDENIMVDDSG